MGRDRHRDMVLRVNFLLNEDSHIVKLTFICPIGGFGFMCIVLQPSPLFTYHPLPSTRDPQPMDPQSPWICLPRSSLENYGMAAPHSAMVIA